jgi:cytochrome oxidase Cu insertion factor (SCO1/SenC/PrrC family)
LGKVEFEAMRRFAGLMLVMSLLAASVWAQRLPKPQIASAEGKLAPDFTLKDQSGKSLRLSSLRGKLALVIFYRGHW